MGTRPSLLRKVVCVPLLVSVSSASWAGQVNILELRNNRPVVLYRCEDKAEAGLPLWTPEKLPWPAVVSDPPDGWIRVTLKDKGDGRKKSEEKVYCVKAYALKTDQSIDVPAECSPAVAQRSAATRGVSEPCKAKH